MPKLTQLFNYSATQVDARVYPHHESQTVLALFLTSLRHYNDSQPAIQPCGSQNLQPVELTTPAHFTVSEVVRIAEYKSQTDLRGPNRGDLICQLVA